MKLLSILFSVFIIALLATKIIQGEWNWTFPVIWGWLYLLFLQDFLTLSFKRNGADDS